MKEYLRERPFFSSPSYSITQASDKRDYLFLFFLLVKFLWSAKNNQLIFFLKRSLTIDCLKNVVLPTLSIIELIECWKWKECDSGQSIGKYL